MVAIQPRIQSLQVAAEIKNPTPKIASLFIIFLCFLGGNGGRGGAFGGGAAGPGPGAWCRPRCRPSIPKKSETTLNHRFTNFSSMGREAAAESRRAPGIE